MAGEMALRSEGLAHVEPALVEATKANLRAAKAPSTRRAYATTWRDFRAWCAARRLAALPAAPETVALFLTSLGEAGRKAATIERAAVALSQAHKAAGHDSPCRAAVVGETLKGLRKRLGVAQAQKAPLVVEAVAAAVRGLAAGLRGLLYRALLLVGFAGAFRRSELVALEVADLTYTPEGMKIRVRRSKTDQEGRGRTVAVLVGEHADTCPVRALQAWLAAAGITRGAVFRPVSRWDRVADRRLCDRTVARLVKRVVRATGLGDVTTFAAHSLRAGFCTSAARTGKTEAAIMRVTGHRSVEMVHRYVREANAFRDHPAEGIGL